MLVGGGGLPSSASSKSLVDVLDSPTRLQELFASFSSGNHPGGEHKEEHQDGSESDSAALLLLEKRLALSAQLGLALLEKQEQLLTENRGLHAKQKELDTSISQLLDRLAQSYKENALLIKRAERANANLEASEASNRQLLITPEEDRKTLRRLNARKERTAAVTAFNDSNDAHSNSPASTNDVEELREELETERRRANAAEAKAKRALAKLADNEQNLQTISQQLDKANEKKGHERKGSHSISATRNRSRPSSIHMGHSPVLPNGEQQPDLIQVVELLRHENETMRQDVQELHALLDSSRDQIASMQAERSEQAVFTPFDEVRSGGDMSIDGGTSNSDALRSPGNSSEPSTSTAPTSQAAYDWVPPPLPSSSLMGRLPHTSNESSSSSTLGSSRGHARRRSIARQFPPMTSRRAGGRAMSVDLSNLMQRKFEDNENDSYIRSPSPILRGATSPVLRPFALGASVNSLTSSMGSPALATAHEDIREQEEHHFLEEHPTILEIGPSPVKSLHEGESGLSLSSPTKRGLRIHHAPQSSTPTQSPSKKDIAVQTVNEHASERSVPHRSNSHAQQDRPQFRQYTSSVLSSDLASELDRSESHAQSHQSSSNAVGGSSSAERGSRTAALNTLMEHVVKLVTRLKGADIISLEQRLKKQNLPGDVSHLAKTTMRDILSEIESMRNHFRQVLEHEAAAVAAENGWNTSDLSSESLMARKDFITVVKLFRDVLYELSRLRLIINRVTLEPHLANKMRDVESVQSPADILAGNIPGAMDKTGPAALLAPLSRLFYGADGHQQNNGSPQHLSANARIAALNKGKPHSRAAASSALAAATVNVEFGGQGGIRRQVSIMPQAGDGGLAGKYNSLGKGSAPGTRAGPRRDLSSIFAGGAGGSGSGSNGGADPWVMLPRNPTGRQLASGNSGAPSSRQRIFQPYSKNVDAVVDSVAENDEFRPNLLERTLRPRGLSDSSIHSTFMNHANPSGRLISPAGLALSAQTDAASTVDPTFAQGDGTVRATLAVSSSARPSILRAVTGGVVGSLTPAKKTSSSRADETESFASTTAVNDEHLSPSKREARATRARAIDGTGDSESGSERGIGLSKSPIGPSGLFANIGAWAARAGSGLSGSYLEPSTLAGGPGGGAGAERRPTLRTVSTTAARKPVNREGEV